MIFFTLGNFYTRSTFQARARSAPLTQLITKHSEKNDRTSSHVTDFTKTQIVSTKTKFEQKTPTDAKNGVPVAADMNG